MSARINGLIRPLATALAAIGLLSACAVMTIDVDVYKGPLANHKDVQTEQIAAMTVAARPLLERLKFDLCFTVRGGIEKEHRFQMREGGEKLETFDGLMDKCHRFGATQINEARRLFEHKSILDKLSLLQNVQRTLSLYDNLSDADPSRVLQQRFKQAVVLAEQISAAFDAFSSGTCDDGTKKEAVSMARSIVTVLPNSQDPLGLYKHFFKGECRGDPDKKWVMRKWRALAIALQEKLDTPDFRKEWRAPTRKALEEVFEGSLPQANRPKAWGAASSNQFFEVWSRQDVLSFQAELLFPEVTQKTRRQRFIKTTSAIATGFIEARAKMESLLLLGLRGFSEYDESIFTSGNAAQQLVADVADGLVYLVDPQHLLLALSQEAAGENLTKFAERFAARLHDRLLIPTSADPYCEGKEIKCSGFPSFMVRGVLAEMITEAPNATGRLLENADKLFRSNDFRVPAESIFGAGEGKTNKPDRKVFERVVERYQIHPERRRFGLAAGPSEAVSRGYVAGLADMFRSGGRTVTDNTTDFLRGRLEDGLYTLIETFLKTSARERRQPCGPEPLCRKPTALGESESQRAQSEINAGSLDTLGDVQRQVLHDALIRFAEKVLFVVNHEVLLQSGGFVTAEANTTTGATREIRGNSSEKSYIRVLQTVGNAILVHVDAMRNEETHEKWLIRAKDREIAAIEQVFGGGASKAFDQLVATLDSDIAFKDRHIKEVEARRKTAQELFDEATKEQAAASAELEKLTPPSPVPTKPDAFKDYQFTWVSLGKDPMGLDKASPNPKPWKKSEKKKDQKFAMTLKDGLDAITTGTDTEKKPTRKALFGKTMELLKLEGRAEIADESGPTARSRRLAVAVAAFGTDGVLDGKLQDDDEVTVDTFLGELEKTLDEGYLKEKWDYFNRFPEEATPTAEFQDAKTKEEEARKKTGAAKTKVDVVKNELEPLTEERATLSCERARLGGVRGAVLKAVEGSGLEEIGRLTKEEAVAQIKAGASDPKCPKVDETVENLPVPVVNPPIRTGKEKNARDVLDGLIAALRHRYTESILKGNAEEARATETAKALAEAYRQRAGMSYLRPAIAYLRTSFTATTLQDNNLAWRNMLEHHGLRSSIPLVPWAMEFNDADNRTVSEVDKQFWQNINRVRVAGAGKANYAIAKDDVGNWYVKSYSTDVEKIVKSAKSLALFATGVPVTSNPTDLLNKAKKPAPEVTPPATPAVTPDTPAGGPQDPKTPDPVTTPAQQPEAAKPAASVFERQFNHFKKKYRAQVLEDIKAVRDAAKSMQTAIRGEWVARNVHEKVRAQLEATIQTGPNDLESKLLVIEDDAIAKIKEGEEADHLAGALRAIKTYHFTVVRRIEDVELKGVTQKKIEKDEDGKEKEVDVELTALEKSAEKNKAILGMTRAILEGTLKVQIQKTKRTMDGYETALDLVGEASGL